MTQRGPWSVKGIDSRAREVAREAAREEGMTLGAYLNKLILEEGSAEAPDFQPAHDHRHAQSSPEPRLQTPPEMAHAARTEPAVSALDRLARRIESAEARSTLAITGIDQSVVGLLSRLENAEHGQQAMGNHLEGVLDDIRKTYDALNLKVKKIEEDDSSATNLKALKALEDALGKLASHVYEENALVGEETSAVKMRLETGLGELAERMDAVDSTIEGRVDQITADFRQTVAEAELRTEGAGKHLAERFTAVEVDVADKLSHVSQMSESMDQVHESMSGALGTVNDTLGAMQERLSRAETVTDKALHSLESRFESLDTRLADVQQFANEEVDQAMRRQFEERFETLATDLRALVASTRAELAEEIEAASKSVDEEVLARIEGSIEKMGDRLDASEDLHAQTMEMVGDTVSRVTDSVDQRLSASQDQQSRAIEQLSTQVVRVSESLDQRFDTIAADLAENNPQLEHLREDMLRFTNAVDERLDSLENREVESLDRVSAEVEKMADRLDERVNASEQRSASAIEQIGEQVSGVAGRLEQRQTEALTAFADKLDATQKRQEARLSSALSNVSDRLERMQEQSIKSISPVQKAILALAQRIDAIEDFVAPPYVGRGDTPAMPDMVAPQKIDTGLNKTTTTTQEEAGSADQSGFRAESLQTFLDPQFDENPDDNDLGELPSFPEPASAFLDDGDDKFEPGFGSWADDANAVLDDMLSDDLDDLDALERADGTLADDDLASAPVEATASSETTQEYFTDLPPPFEDDALASDAWGDGREEARDSDIFGDDDAALPPLNAEQEKLDAFETNATPLSDPNAGSANLIDQARNAARQAAADKEVAKGKSRRSSAGGNKKVGMAAGALAVVAITGVSAKLFMDSQKSVPPLSLDSNTQDASAELASTDAPSLQQAWASISEGDAAADATHIGEAEFSGNQTAAAETLATGNETTDPTASDALAQSSELDNQITPVSGTSELVAAPSSFSAPRIPLADTIDKAAERGDRIAQYRLGMARLEAGNFDGGANMIRQAAAQGLAVAQHELAILHEQGTGVSRDPVQARDWHSKAARGGNVQAMFDFASFNANGEGGERNEQVAAEWFRKAAEFGHTDSQYNIGAMFEQGNGVSPSLIEAMFWLEIAAKNGDGDARAAATEIASDGRVSAEAADQVRTRVAAWRPSRASGLSNGQIPVQSWQRPQAEQVRAAQQVLNALGYDVGTPDGAFGTRTATAIRGFETDSGLPVSGKLNDRVVNALNDAADARRTRL